MSRLGIRRLSCPTIGINRKLIPVNSLVEKPCLHGAGSGPKGLVRRARTSVRNGPGQPANLYEAAPGSEDVSSSAYQVVLAALMGELGSRLPAAKLSDILEQTGRRLAREAKLNPTAGFDKALRAALAAVERLGASSEVVKQPGGVLVRNYSCPVASAVRTEPCVCRALAAFFSEATGQPAVEQCLRDDRLICQYLVQRPAKGTRRARSVP